MLERPNSGRRAESPERPRPVHLEDDALIEKTKAGRTDAFGELVRRYQDRVFNACWRICGNLEDARDLTQEAFLKAFAAIGSFRRDSQFYTWIFRVAVNLTLSHRRREARRRTVSLDQAEGAVAGQAEVLAARVGGSGDADAVKRTSDAELHRCVLRAMHDLDDDQRVVIVLRDVEGLDYREIGEILEIPPGTVKSRLHRARMAIRESILPMITQH